MSYGYVSDRKILIAFLLCFFLGYLGFHRFYAGKVGTGVLYLLTGGLFGIGVLVDCILLVFGSFKDGDGLPLREWT
jgi:TM2 domain-containing membrane protein YozV